MTKEQWNHFLSFRENFKEHCQAWSALSNVLEPLQKEAAQKDTPDYQVENPVVYNTDLDKITPSDTIKLIVIGDNPGKNEQLTKNRRYLCGQAGKIADGFFKRNPVLAIDFRKNVIILNKTPVHTAKTAHLKSLLKSGNKEVADIIIESQVWMAKATASLHQSLYAANTDAPCKLWLVGYSELKGKGLFLPYQNAFYEAYKNKADEWNAVKVYQHFSMNRFSIDLAAFQAENTTNGTQKTDLSKTLDLLGKKHRDEIFS